MLGDRYNVLVHQIEENRLHRNHKNRTGVTLSAWTSTMVWNQIRKNHMQNNVEKWMKRVTTIFCYFQVFVVQRTETQRLQQLVHLLVRICSLFPNLLVHLLVLVLVLACAYVHCSHAHHIMDHRAFNRQQLDQVFVSSDFSWLSSPGSPCLHLCQTAFPLDWAQRGKKKGSPLPSTKE